MLQEGLAREFVNRVQKLRKSCGVKQADKVRDPTAVVEACTG